MMNIENIKKFLPRRIVNLRHLFYSWYGAVKYRHPSKKILVIGVTGTSGKSTTIFLLRQLLESAGYKVGSLSTIDFYINGENKLNDQKMTMLGKMKIQQYLREMVDKKCDVAIVETTSEGWMQYRNRYIAYDMMILTNLYPEHIESHGGFENYKQAKLEIFRRAARYGFGKSLPKNLEIKDLFNSVRKDCCGEIIKTFFINGDIPQTGEFIASVPANFGKRIIFGITEKSKAVSALADEIIFAEDIYSDKNGLHFRVGEHHFDPKIFGEHNVMNILIVIAAARRFGIDWDVIEKTAAVFKNAPGRNEFIPEAESRGFKVIVDYAFEPKAMAALYSVAKLLEPKRLIHVFGSTGGGRDAARRFTLGEMSARTADMCVVTDEDPYDDDPLAIMEDVASAARKAGKRDGVDLFVVPDRREAIRRGLALAEPGDLVLVTGKGSEQAMVLAHGKKIPWDDRAIVREELERLT